MERYLHHKNRPLFEPIQLTDMERCSIINALEYVLDPPERTVQVYFRSDQIDAAFKVKRKLSRLLLVSEK